MNEFMVIFSVAAFGCLVRLSTDLIVQFFARKVPSGTIATGPHHGQAPESQPQVDPWVTVGLTLTCYGAIALALVSELPGTLAFQRTWLAFALLCVGGLIGEISRTGSGVDTGSAESDLDADESEAEERTSGSVGLSVALMLALILTVAVLSSGQGLVQIVPPPVPASDNQSTELEQIVVVARRGSDDLGSSSTFL